MSLGDRLAQAPPSLLEQLQQATAPPEPRWTHPPPVDDDEDSAAAHFNASSSWHSLLTRDGWTLARTLGNGEEQWTRPGKTPREGISATVGHGGADCLKVFTSSVPELTADTAYSRFGYEAAVRWHGDRSALARDIRRQLLEAARADEEAGWRYFDTGPAANGANGNGANGHGSKGARAGRSGVVATSSITPERVTWLWEGRLPVGKLVVLDGDPDLGKSTLSLDLAARLSRGKPMPDGQRLVGPSDVILMSAEDGPADTIRPRLDAAGADLDRVHIWMDVEERRGDTIRRRPPSLPSDIPMLEEHIRGCAARLVIIDVLSAYLGGAVNSNQDQDIRRVLHALMIVAERTSSTILALRHLNKSGGGKAIYRGGGSIGIVGAARVGLVVGRDPEDQNRSILAVAKCNLAARPKALAYQIVASAPEHGCGRIEWLGTTGHTADALVIGPKPEDDDDRPRQLAMEFLRTLLAEGPKPVQVIKAEGADAGLSWRTLRRAQEDLGIVPRKVGKPGDREQWWEWGIPLPKVATDPEDGQLGQVPNRWTSSEKWTPSEPVDTTDSGQAELQI